MKPIFYIVQHLFTNPKKIFSLLSPDFFPFGAEIEHIEFDISNDQVIKYYRKNKKEKYQKNLLFLQKYNHIHFFPKIYDFNNEKMIIKMSYCGKLLHINNNLPPNWEIQLIHIKNILQKNKIYSTDIKLWDINPYIINNLCIKNNKIYLIDFGDMEQNIDPITIDNYFSNLILQIQFVKKNHYLIVYIRNYFILIVNFYCKYWIQWTLFALLYYNILVM